MSKENDILVQVEGLSKKFCKDLKTSLWYGVKDLVSNLFGNGNERVLRPKEFWALKDISFELRRGECLGLIGHNGAGKSTLLKLLNGLIQPDAGKVIIKGRVGALIELGAGFNPILTGRENIYNNGAILGFTKKEIDGKLQTIIDFAELEEFIDMPVQHYSSGMKVRLGFAIAAQMEPDVLIIDEVLAVGDIGFRIKCFNTISFLLQKCAVIIVSHSMPDISKSATVGLLMENGKERLFSEDVSKVIELYNSKFSYSDTNVVAKGIKLKRFFINNENAFEKKNIDVEFGSDINLLFGFEGDKAINKNIECYNIIIIVLDKELKPVATTSSPFFGINEGLSNINFEFRIQELRLIPSQYSISFTFNYFFDIANHQREILYYGQNITSFNILNGPLINNHAVVILESNMIKKRING